MRLLAIAFKWASRSGKFEMVKLLLSDKRVDPSSGNNYALNEASKEGHYNVVKLLLSDERVNLSSEDYYAVKEAT